MLLFQALVLGLLQGLTEFLPVSSSGHLQGVPYLFGWASGSLAFDVMVHAGTLVAVIAYFRKDLWQLTTDAFGIGVDDPAARRRAWHLIGLLAVGSVPAAAAGVLFEDTFAAAFESPRMVAVFLYLTALLLWTAERVRRRRQVALRKVVDGDPAAEVAVDQSGRGDADLRVRDATCVGLAQALAIFPGISRSGATIAAGMALGMSRAAAARFSFLLSIPIIIGATLFKLPDLGTVEPGTLPFGGAEIVVGVVAAAASGYWAIRFLLALVQRRDLLGFARYVVVFATILLVATFVIG